MPSPNGKLRRKTMDKVLTAFGVIAAAALIAMGGLAWWAYSFTTSSVRNELAAQKIYFPPPGNMALTNSAVGPYLNQYAGQQLVTGPQARAYADHFIAVHLSEVANQQTYAQVSAQALANPANTQLKQQAQTLFQGETLRGLLLNAYAFWTVGYIAYLAAIVCFAASGVMVVLILLGLWHISRS
jgi:hypothetical protein